VIALAVPSVASAESPYRFSDRAAFERSVAQSFVKLELAKKRLRYTVTGIGCAKTGIGRAWCAVSARGPVGRQVFAVKVTCGKSACRVSALPLGRR
jgi:hypothetical protein